MAAIDEGFAGEPLFSQSLQADSPAIALSQRLPLYLLIVLALMNTLNYLDRQVINIVVELIKHDLRLKDWQVGVLTGLAFAIFYTVCAIPIARLAERVHRPSILGASLAAWSIFTVVCAGAQNFVQLALARLGVGLGEAGGTPAAHALLTDATPPSKRAFAMAVFSAGIPFGGLLGLMIGGVVADRYGWRAAFLVAGAPGILMSVIIATTIKEPRGGGLRRDLANLFTPRQDSPRLKDALKELLAKRSFLLIGLGGASGGLVNYVQAAFTSAFFLRVHLDFLTAAGVTLGNTLHTKLGPVGLLGLLLGMLVGVGGILGTLTGGWLTDRAAKRSPAAYMWVAGGSKLVAAPLGVALLLSPSAPLAFFFAGLVAFVRGMSFAPGFGSVQGLVRPALRPTASAALFFIINLLGLGLGPLLVGILSDTMSSAGMGPREGLRMAMICAEVVGMLGASFYFFALPFYVREVTS